MIVAIIQARLGSTRLPQKIMKKFKGIPLIKILIERVKLSKKIDKILIATGPKKKNLNLINYLKNERIDFFCGSEENVLKRYLNAAEYVGANTIVRITGDCPLIDYKLIDKIITRYKSSNLDYISNIDPPTYPDGQDIEIFSYKTLKKISTLVKKKYDKEHVTPFMRKSIKIKKKNILNNKDYSNLRWTLDTNSDLLTIKNVLEYFHPSITFSWLDILKLNEKKPELFKSNKHIIRNQGIKC